MKEEKRASPSTPISPDTQQRRAMPRAWAQLEHSWDIFLFVLKSLIILGIGVLVEAAFITPWLLAVGQLNHWREQFKLEGIEYAVSTMLHWGFFLWTGIVLVVRVAFRHLKEIGIAAKNKTDEFLTWDGLVANSIEIFTVCLISTLLSAFGLGWTWMDSSFGEWLRLNTSPSDSEPYTLLAHLVVGGLILASILFVGYRLITRWPTPPPEDGTSSQGKGGEISTS